MRSSDRSRVVQARACSAASRSREWWRVEDRVREDRRSCGASSAGMRARRCFVEPAIARQRSDRARRTAASSASMIGARRRLVERDADAVFVDARRLIAARRARAPWTRIACDRRSSTMQACRRMRAVSDRDSRAASAPAPDARSSRCTRCGDALQPCRAVIDRVHAAMMASSTCAVQMLVVAFSRRICCSRVCSASR